MRLLRPALLVTLAFVLAGCFQVASTLTVRPDGSALLEDRFTFTGLAAFAMAEAAADDSSDVAFQERAAALGEGVQLVSVERDEDGFTAVYSVPDVRRLRYTSPDPGLGEDDEDETVADESLTLAFDFDEGNPAVLRIVVPEDAPDEDASEDAASGAPTEEELQETRSAFRMARALLGDARMTVEVVVEGEVVETDAALVDESTVTVYDLHMDAVFEAMEEDPRLMEGPKLSGDRMRALLAGREGVHLEEPGTVTVRFR